MKSLLASLLTFIVLIGASRAESGYWPDDYLDAFSKIPLMDDGRVKPMDTFARVTLISIHGRASHKLGKKGTTDSEAKAKLSADEWLLDVFFRPEVAQNYPTFQINNVDVITALGLAPHLKDSGKVMKRDYYSYNEIVAARTKLAELSDKYRNVKDSDRTVVQQQLVDLSSSMSRFEGLSLLFKFTQHGLPLDPSNVLATEVAEGSEAPVSALFENLEPIKAAIKRIQTSGIGDSRMDRSIELLSAFIQSSTMVTLIPPSQDGEPWTHPGNLMQSFLAEDLSESESAANLKTLKLIEHLANDATDENKRMASLQAYKNHVVAQTKALGLYDDIESEVKFYKWKNLLLGPWLFVVGFLILAVSWLSPGSRFGFLVRRLAFGWLCIPSVLLVLGITWRCILRDRPPVTSLYETILFITAVAVLLLLITEWIKKTGLALALVPFLGAAGLFLGMRFELADGQDTIKPLIAVLDTNYWLATHVTTVTMGYAAGLAAAGFSILYVLSRLVDPLKKRFSRAYYKEITSMTYGIICFGLLFSLVGTILGGIWANESWGRFWGWDPKENGALMIVLMNLIILHGRVGGLLRELTLHLATLFGAIVVCYSWWGVNLLETGLHSYGFVSGVKTALHTAYGTLYTFMVIGACVGIYEWSLKRIGVTTTGGQPQRTTALAAWAIFALIGLTLMGIVMTQIMT